MRWRMVTERRPGSPTERKTRCSVCPQKPIHLGAVRRASTNTRLSGEQGGKQGSLHPGYLHFLKGLREVYT